MAFCSNCGTPIAAGVNFCGHCGAQLAVPSPSQPYAAPPAPAKRRTNVGLVVLFTCLGLLVLLPVLGVVASISIPAMVSARTNAVNEKARNSLRTIISAEAAYYSANNRYGDFGDLTGVVPPFLDARFSEGADIGQGIIVHLSVTGTGFLATIETGDTIFEADESGNMKETVKGKG